MDGGRGQGAAGTGGSARPAPTLWAARMNESWAGDWGRDVSITAEHGGRKGARVRNLPAVRSCEWRPQELCGRPKPGPSHAHPLCQRPGTVGGTPWKCSQSPGHSPSLFYAHRLLNRGDSWLWHIQERAPPPRSPPRSTTRTAGACERNPVSPEGAACVSVFAHRPQGHPRGAL
jgi:hypothetical protein